MTNDRWETHQRTGRTPSRTGGDTPTKWSDAPGWFMQKKCQEKGPRAMVINHSWLIVINYGLSIINDNEAILNNHS